MGECCSKSGDRSSVAIEVKEDHGNVENAESAKSVSVEPSTKQEEKSNNIYSIQSTSKDQVDEGASPRLEQHYKMDHKNRGMALIFNHEQYDFDIDPRKGTNVDRDRLQDTLQRLRFKVRAYNDLKMNDIMTTLKTVSKMDHSDNDCLVVVFLTHGKLLDFQDPNSCNTILNHDLMCHMYAKDETYPMHEVWSYFTDEACPSLANKPRIILVQACPGEEREKTVKIVPHDKWMRKTDQTLMPKKDFLVAYSFLPGFGSFRDPRKGSFFIQSICDEINKRETTDDLVTTLTRVTQKVANDNEAKLIEAEQYENKPIPLIISRLTKLVVFSNKYGTCQKFKYTADRLI